MSSEEKNKRVWRCLSRLEHETEFCFDSITIDDETLKKTIVRGIGKAISDKQDVLDLILSNLAYAVTGEDDTAFILRCTSTTFNSVNFVFLRRSGICNRKNNKSLMGF